MQHLLSYWERSILLRKFDFVVLGAGLVGKQIAIKLKKKHPSARIAIVDRSPISYGASTRNAGFACFGSVSEIADDFNRSPEEVVITLLEKRYKGIQELVSSFGADNIGYRHTGSYEVFRDADAYGETVSRKDYINRLIEKQLGITGLFTVRDTSSMRMSYYGKGLFNQYEGMLNSGMLNEVLSDITHRSGVIPLYGLTVTALLPEHNGYRLQTEGGTDITCDQLIVANNAFAPQLMPDMDIVPARGQVIVTKPLPQIPFDGVFHCDRGYIYFRNIDNRVLIGGGRNLYLEQEKTYDFGGSNALKEYLSLYLREVVLPGTEFGIDMHWSGIMAMGAEKIPIVERVNEHLLVCVRMSGMGVALGPVLSSEIVDMC